MVPSDFEAFARERSARLLRLAFLLTGNQQDAEDLAQTALVRMQERWDQVSSADNVGAYAHRVLVNQFLSSTRRRTLDIVPLQGDWVNASLQPDHASLVAEREQLKQALCRLPPRQRAALVLRYYVGLDTHEVSLIMEIHESSARSAMSRGLESLRRWLCADDEGWENSNAAIRD